MEWYRRRLDSLTENEYNECLRLMEPQRAAQVRSLPAAVAGPTVLGEWMVKCALCTALKRPIETLRLARDKRGKPFLMDGGMHFNISHSGDWVVCALHTAPVGIDIQELRPVSPALSRRLCTEDDLGYLRQAADRHHALLSLWSAKEAYFKYVGSGITDLKSVSLSDLQSRLYQKSEENYILSIYY